MTEEIVVIPDDDIGAEITPTAVDVLGTVGDFESVGADAGDHVKEETGGALPQEVYNLAAKAGAALSDAADETATDVILPLRTAVDSFVNVRPAEAYPGVDVLRPEVGLVFFRENTEGVYSGHEDRPSEDLSTLTRVVTTSASKRLTEHACDYIGGEGDNFQIIREANVMRETGGRFHDAAVTVADERGVEAKKVPMDTFVTRVRLDPTQFDTIVCPNLAGDVLSDLAAGLVGDPGLLPPVNIGPDAALFESIHGSAPDIAGEDIANPAVTILSAVMLLDYLDRGAEVDRVRSTVGDVLADGPRTPDLGGDASTEGVTAAILDRL